jgi:SAM-dependent MidA family methyltransferase
VRDLEASIAERIATAGPIGFDEYVDHALYAPGLGFYARGGGAGRRRDFLTSAEVGPLFGAVMARALDQWWDELGRPDPYVVVEAGAGPGTLARAVLAAGPRCSAALRLVLVEPAELQWVTHPAGTVSRADLPHPADLGDGPVIVLANELLDNLAFGLVERADVGWCEVMVDVDGHAAGRSHLAEAADGCVGDHGPADEPARLVEVLVPLEPRRAAWCTGKAGRDAPLGTRLPVQAAAAAWLHEALALAGGGRVVVIDYASTTRELARRPWTGWVRTYTAHGRAGHPLTDPGAHDITVEVAVDQLATVAPPDLDRSQADFLAAHGLAELVAEGAVLWREAGAAGGLAAVAGRSRVHEADALTDPSGLGGFRVLEWVS